MIHLFARGPLGSTSCVLEHEDSCIVGALTEPISSLMLSAIAEPVVLAGDDYLLLLVLADVAALETIIFTPTRNGDSK